jgi:imidazolonepropionase-like amidohydrolase
MNSWNGSGCQLVSASASATTASVGHAHSLSFVEVMPSCLPLVPIAGLGGLERAARGGVKLVYGTDLLGDMHRYQNREFKIRQQVQQPIDIIRAATANAAELLGMAGEIGTLQPGAHADLIVVDGDPLADIDVLAESEHITRVVQAGRIVKDDRGTGR